MTNELVNTQTGEITTENTVNKVVRQNDNYTVFQGEDGKFFRRAKYEDYSSFQAESREDKLWLLNILDGGEEEGSGLRDNIGKEIEVEHIITRKYDLVNEDTGEEEYGVLTYLITPNKEVYVTSSKSIYFSIKRMMEVFGAPHEEHWENLTVKIGSVKAPSGNTALTIKAVG